MTARIPSPGFSTATSSLLFLDPLVDYGGGTGNDVVLTLQPNANLIASFGTTPYQRAAGGAIDTLGMGNDVYDAFLSMTNTADVARGLQLSSGESYATDLEVMQGTASLFSRGLLGRTGGGGSAAVNTGMGDAGAASGYVETPLLNEAADAISGALTPKRSETAPTAWFAPVGAHGHIDGVTAGYEFGQASESGDFPGGIAVGYLHSNGDTDGNLTSEKTDGGQLGVYGRWISGPVTISGALAGGLSQSRTARRIDIAGLDLQAKSSTWSQVLDASTEVSYAIPLQSDFTLSPLVSLAGVFIHRNATTESGAGGFDLDVDSKSHGQLTPGLGIELTHATDVKDGVVNTHIRTVWEHVIGDTVDQSLQFAGSDAAYTVKAPDLTRDRLRLGLGISYQTTNRWSLFADYQGVFSSGPPSMPAASAQKWCFKAGCVQSISTSTQLASRCLNAGSRLEEGNRNLLAAFHDPWGRCGRSFIFDLAQRAKGKRWPSWTCRRAFSLISSPLPCR